MARDILVPVDHVVAIYARENGQGMAFPMPTGDGETSAIGDNSGPVTHSTAPAADGAPRGLRLAPSGATTQSDEGTPEAPADDDTDPPESPTPAPSAPRPALKRIK